MYGGWKGRVDGAVIPLCTIVFKGVWLYGALADAFIGSFNPLLLSCHGNWKPNQGGGWGWGDGDCLLVSDKEPKEKTVL